MCGLATLAVRDRRLVQRTLSDAGVPVPPAAEVPDAEAARRWAAGRPVVVKSDDATAGRGVGVVLWSDPGNDEPPPADGPYLVQEWVPGDGVDRKLYVIGDRTDGLLKPRGTGTRSGEPFALTAQLVAVARAVGEALGLSIYGVDVVEGPAGPVVVDVNTFPSCAGVPGAAADIAGTLLGPSRRRRTR